MTRYLVTLLCVTGLLTGCAKDIEMEEDGPPADGTQAVLETTKGNDDTLPNASIIADNGTDANANIMVEEVLTAKEMLEEKDSPLTTRIIYFDYNSAKIDDASLAVLESHGDFISENGDVHVRLEGHTDERGSREFNVALGDRRNQSVRRLLLFQGASTDQIETVSYGEELPDVLGHNDAAWLKNRRVELIYKIK